VRHWRSYSLTSPPDAADGCLELTVQAHPGGLVSGHLAHTVQAGDIVRLTPADGTFVLPPDPPAPLLMITAGSGITPVMAMLRDLATRGPLPDIVLLHSAPGPTETIFRDELRELARRHPRLRLHLRATATEGRLQLAELDRLCPDWTRRTAYVCGPDGLRSAADAHWAERPDQLHIERFTAATRSPGGAGGPVHFGGGEPVEVDGASSLLEAGEAAGALLPSGCRMGICFGCVLPLRDGQVRDLRTGRVHGEPGDLIQTCISGASGAARLDLPTS
jgi:ferredoxin-NADP reductase